MLWRADCTALDRWLSCLCMLGCLVIAAFVSGCSSAGGGGSGGIADGLRTTASASAVGASAAGAGHVAAKVQKGDKLKVSVFNEPLLSGDYTVWPSGTISYPLIGEVPVEGLTVREAQQTLIQRLNGRYLVNPHILVELISQKPIYVLGEVAKAGEYPYRDGLTAMSAIALAGGFGPRAATGTVLIRRANETETRRYEVASELLIFPGDVITVSERIF